MLTDAEILDAISDEAGAASTLYSADEARRWFNQGAARLNRYVLADDTITWAAGDTDVTLPADYVSFDALDYDTGVVVQPFRMFGNRLIVDCPGGASRSGSARIYYFATYPKLEEDGTSAMSDAEDYACVVFALHRLFRKLASNRVQYQRYSTLLGANAISVADLQAESDRLLQDFLDSRDDLPLQDSPAGW